MLTAPTFVIALAGAILGAASLVLHVVAPRTKNTIDDKIRDQIDEVLAIVHGTARQSARLPPVVPSSKPPGAGSATMLLILLVSALALPSACGPSQVAGHAIIECTKADQAQLDELIAKLSLLLAGEQPDWGMVEHEAIGAGETIGGCALAEVIQHYLAPPPGRTAPSADSGKSARATLEDFRARFANGATFRTKSGDL